MRWYVLGSLAVACLVALSLTKSSSEAYVTAYPGQPDIDGIRESIIIFSSGKFRFVLYDS